MQNDMTIDGFKIAVWTSEHSEPPCIAVNMTIAIGSLEGYNLTEEEKTSLPELMAGYCRLVDESNFVGYGETEFESIADLFSHARKI